MRRTYGVVVAVAGVSLVTGCADGPQRVAGEAGPVGAASPAASVSVSASAAPAVVTTSPSPSPSRTTSSPRSTATGLPKRLSPDGYGPLKIGMTRKQAVATGLLGSRTTGGDDDLCSTYELVPAKTSSVLVVYSTEMGIVAIPAPAGVSTPEGIRVGSTARQVRDAYSDLEGEESLGLYANQNDGDDSRYEFHFEKGKVVALFVGRTAADCG